MRRQFSAPGPSTQLRARSRSARTVRPAPGQLRCARTAARPTAVRPARPRASGAGAPEGCGPSWAWWAVSCCWSVVGVVILINVVGGATNHARGLADDFTKLVIAGETSKAYDEYLDPALQEQVSKEDVHCRHQDPGDGQHLQAQPTTTSRPTPRTAPTAPTWRASSPATAAGTSTSSTASRARTNSR